MLPGTGQDLCLRKIMRLWITGTIIRLIVSISNKRAFNYDNCSKNYANDFSRLHLTLKKPIYQMKVDRQMLLLAIHWFRRDCRVTPRHTICIRAPILNLRWLACLANLSLLCFLVRWKNALGFQALSILGVVKTVPLWERRVIIFAPITSAPRCQRMDAIFC
jgi:hypothetical protein